MHINGARMRSGLTLIRPVGERRAQRVTIARMTSLGRRSTGIRRLSAISDSLAAIRSPEVRGRHEPVRGRTPGSTATAYRLPQGGSRWWRGRDMCKGPGKPPGSLFLLRPPSRDQIRIRLHCTAAASPSGLSRQCIKRRRKATQRQRQCILPAFT